MKKLSRLAFLLGLSLACSNSTPPLIPTASLPPEPSATSPAPEPSPSPSPSFTSTPAPTATATQTPLLRFAAIGDFGEVGPDAQAVADLVKSWLPEFIITLGDNNYPSGAASTIDANIGQYYHEYIYPYLGGYGEGADTFRFFPALGNHDWLATDAQPYLDYFTLPGNERYYDFVWGPVHFFVVDSDSHEPDGIGKSSAQAAWLQAALAASTAPWKIVYMHHPPFSSAHHGSSLALQWPYKDWGASVVLAGHDHTYERLVIDGLPYVVNGLGGNPNRYYFFTPLPGSQVRYREAHGALLVEATSEVLFFQFINTLGEIIDSFTLTKETSWTLINSLAFEER